MVMCLWVSDWLWASISTVVSMECQWMTAKLIQNLHLSKINILLLYLLINQLEFIIYLCLTRVEFKFELVAMCALCNLSNEVEVTRSELWHNIECEFYQSKLSHKTKSHSKIEKIWFALISFISLYFLFRPLLFFSDHDWLLVKLLQSSTFFPWLKQINDDSQGKWQERETHIHSLITLPLEFYATSCLFLCSRHKLPYQS